MINQDNRHLPANALRATIAHEFWIFDPVSVVRSQLRSCSPRPSHGANLCEASVAAVPSGHRCVDMHWGPRSQSDARSDFRRDIEPILISRCYSCHGPKSQISGLRLDVRETALKGGDSGVPAIVPGRSGETPPKAENAKESPSDRCRTPTTGRRTETGD